LRWQQSSESHFTGLEACNAAEALTPSTVLKLWRRNLLQLMALIKDQAASNFSIARFPSPHRRPNDDKSAKTQGYQDRSRLENSGPEDALLPQTGQAQRLRAKGGGMFRYVMRSRLYSILNWSHDTRFIRYRSWGT